MPRLRQLVTEVQIASSNLKVYFTNHKAKRNITQNLGSKLKIGKLSI